MSATTWNSKSGPVRLLFAARLIRQRGVAELLEAVRTQGQIDAELDLTIVGEGPC